jgi:hypothetical protein
VRWEGCEADTERDRSGRDLGRTNQAQYNFHLYRSFFVPVCVCVSAVVCCCVCEIVSVCVWFGGQNFWLIWN